MRFASERGEASYYTCHKMDNCVSASYVINEIIMVVYGKINSSYSFKGLIFCLYLKWAKYEQYEFRLELYKEMLFYDKGIPSVYRG